MQETRAAFARRLGVHRSFVTRAVQAGRIVLNGKNVDVEASLLRMQETTGARADVAERHAAQRHAAVGEPHNTTDSATHEQPEGEPTTSGDEISRAKWQTVRMHYENQLTKLAMALRRHQRYAVADVRREALAIGTVLRASVERVIDQIAPRLAVMNEADRAGLLHTEIKHLRRVMRNEFVQALRRLRRNTNRNNQQAA